jgi:hypothetical protein
MRKIILLMSVLLAWASSLTAQITREQADTIVFQYIQDEVTTPCLLYVYNQTPSANEMTINTYNDEIIKVKYACWTYYLNENPEIPEPCQHRYLFVKENDGNLLEIITSNDLGPEELTEWEPILGIIDREREENILVYPNPTTGELRITNYGLQIDEIEIYDVYGRKLSSNHLIDSSPHPHINISHLSAGIYFLKLATPKGITLHKIIKH